VMRDGHNGCILWPNILEKLWTYRRHMVVWPVYISSFLVDKEGKRAVSIVLCVRE